MSSIGRQRCRKHRRVATLLLAVVLGGCASVDERLLGEGEETDAEVVGDDGTGGETGTGGEDVPPPPVDTDPTDSVDAAIAGCEPNPENELCPEICPELCNGMDDDCDGNVDEDAELTDCAAPHGSSTCSQGQCLLTGCDDGFRDCDGKVDNGCEADTSTAEHCGRCNNACQFDNALAACVDGTCEPAGCVTPFLDCVADDGACETLGETVNDCGGCGISCAGIGRAIAACSDSLCVVDECIGNFGDCNGDVEDGCEFELNEPSNCGGCGVGCSYLGSSTSCDTGTCIVDFCAPGFADCDGSPITACESLDSEDNCGGCGQLCTVAGLEAVTAAACAERVCIIECQPQYGDCDAVLGCETELTSVTHCGGCNVGCAPDHAFGSCEGGSCGVGECHPDWADCDGEVDNGCEVNVTDRANCGGCDNACMDSPVVIGCNQGECRGAVCTEGTADCDDDEDTCEADLGSDATCGSCGVQCAFDVAQGHGSLACTVTDATPGTMAWACQITQCDDGFADCDADYRNGCEVTLTEFDNCGGCGTVCSKLHATPSCADGSCKVATCDLDWEDCDSDGLDCETQLDTTSDCGSCGNTCDFDFALGVCSGSPGSRSCTISSCVPTEYANCDDEMGNGCEVDTSSDPLHCNGCGNNCNLASNVASAICNGSQCVYSCQTGYDDCDPQDGCETSLLEVASCGDCDTDCRQLPQVDGVSCLPNNGNPLCVVDSCSSGYADCGSAPGCETNTDTSVEHCGACSGDTGWQVCTGLPGVTTSVCVAGSCSISECTGALEDCNRDVTDGCEWDPATAGECCDSSGDFDNDGANDCVDECPTDSAKQFEGVCGCFVPDTNSDADAALDCEEECDLDPNKTVPGACGCGNPDTGVDIDGDGMDDCVTIKFVDINVSGGLGDGSSWENAFADLRNGIAAASSGQHVWVKEGTYTNTPYDLKGDVLIFGGFSSVLGGVAGNLGARDFSADATVTDAGGSGRVWAGRNNGHLDGFTIFNGDANPGGGMDLRGESNVVLANCLFDSNHSNGLGGAIIQNGNSSVTLDDCTFRNNTADRSAAIHVEGPTTIRGTVFENNRGGTSSYGGGAIVNKDNLLIDNCLFINNYHPDEGGAVWNYAGGDTTTIRNSTFVGNTGGATGYAVYRNNGTVTIDNSVMWGNSTGHANSDVSITYSLVEGGGTADGNLNGDPVFAVGPGGAYYLGTGSPAVNAGNDTAAARGLDTRTTRVDGVVDTGTVDLGYHYPTN